MLERWRPSTARMSGLQLREDELAEQDDDEPSKKLGVGWARTRRGEGRGASELHEYSGARREELRGDSLAPAPTSFFSLPLPRRAPPP